MNGRLVGALVCYGILFGLAFLLLTGVPMKAVLILLAGLLAKTLIAWKANVVPK